MPNLSHLLADGFKTATHKAFPDLDNIPIELVTSTNEKFGHYQFNSAMKLAKPLQSNPRAVAEKIVQHFGTHPAVEKLAIAGPGFINITLSPAFLTHLINHTLRDPHLGVDKPEHPKNVIVEFSSPNIAKEMHVGHLRSTIIGESIARLFEFLGHNVLRLNHVGDWGTQFGMLIAYMQEYAPGVLNGTEPTDLSHLTIWYKNSKAKFDADPQFKKLSQLKVVDLQGGDPEALKAWKIICEISQKAYQEIYDLLDIRLEERGESFYNLHLPEVVKDLEKKGLVKISEGAKCIYLEGFQNREGQPLPIIIQKSDGGYNYDTTDMAAIKHRVEVEKADWVIYVIDAGQSLHMQMIFKAAEKAGYLNPSKTRADHVAFGLVLGLDGKKFRTRAGETEKLIDLLTTAIDYARKILLERSPDMPEKEREHLAKTLGLASIKYADLSNHRMSDYAFSYEKMLKFEGNTAPYLMYAYVRVAGIKRKVGLDIQTILQKDKIHLEHPAEIALGLHVLQFPEALELMSEDLLPNRLTDYLYTLAEKFNAFFRDCRVEGTPQQNSRLLLCEVVAKILKQGLYLLGIDSVERM